VILISHDRDFLDRVGDLGDRAGRRRRWIEYAGGYTDMLAQRGLRQQSVGMGIS
jgi:ATP-binding cassette subfamily F protein uup